MSAKDSSSSSSSEDEHPTETQKTQEEHVEQKDSEKPQEEKKPEEHKESNAEKKDESQSNENQEQKNEEKPKKKKKKSEGAEGEKKKKKKKKSTSEGATEGAEGEKKKKKKSEKPAEGSGSPEAEKKESNDAKEAKPKKEKKEKKPEKSDSTEKVEKSPSSEKKDTKEKETKEVKEAKPKKEKKEKEAKPTKQVSLPPQDNKTDEQRAEEENLRKSELEKGLVILDEYSEETKKIADQVREIENPPVQPAAHGKEKEPAHQIPKTRDIVKALFEGIRKHKTDAKLIQGSLLTARHLKDKEGIRHDVRAVEGLPLLVELLISDDVNIRRTSLRFIGDLITKNHSPDNVANGEAFLTAGGVPNVIKMMEDVEDIQIMAIGVVRVLAMFEGRSNAGFLEEIRANKGLSPLVPFLKSTSNDLIRQAASAIQYLCDGSRDNQAIFTDHDVVTILVDQIVVTLEEKVLVRLIDTFYSVLNNYEKAIKKAVSHKNLVEALGKLLQSGTIPQLKESVLRLFSVLAFHEDSVRVYARENGLLQYIIEQVIDEKNLAQEAVQRANVIALGALSQSGENMTIILESKVVDTLVAMTTNANDKVQAIGVLGLKPLVTISAEAQDKLIKSEGMQKLVPLLTSKNVESQENALEVLRQSRASVKSILVLQIPVLVELLASPSSNIREASITCIESLLTDENAINMLAREKKLVDRLAECMDGTREKLTVRACSTVDSLVTKGKLIDAIYKSYIPQKLSLLLPANNQKVKQHAVYALWAIANNSSKSQTLFAKLGCLKELLSLTVKDDSSSLLKEYAAGAVCSLVVAHSSNKKIFLAEGGVEKLTTLLTNESDGVKIYAAKALWAAAEETPAIQEVSLNSLEGLLSMLKSKNPAVQASAASAVWSISEKNPKLQEAVREKGLIPWIVDIVNWHAKEYLADPKTKLNEQSYLTAAVGAIAALTLKNVGNKEAFLDAGALNSIESLKDVPDRTLKKEVASCLLSLDSKARPRSGSIFQMVAAALKKDKSAENVKDKDSKKKEIKEIKSDEKSNDNANKEDKEDKPKDEEKKEDKPSEEKPKEEEKPKQEEKKEDEKKEDEKKDDASSSSESSSSESSDAE